MPDCTIFADHQGASASVVVIGELDMYTAPHLRHDLVGLMARGARQITVDLGGVEFIDSTALGVLVGILKRLRQSDGNLQLLSPRPGILKVLEMTGLTQIFTVIFAAPTPAGTPPA